MQLEYFQLIDRIVDLNLADRTIRAEATVPLTSSIFEGHFPGHPLMPGVLLIEAMAQTAGWLIIAATRFERMPFLAAVKEAKLRTFVTPGQLLSVTADLVHEGSGYAMTAATGAVDGKPVCNAEITFKVMDFPNRDFRAHLEEWAARLQFPAEARAHG
jgi:3-hydroxyacyl-[acyl-carrier-protein] dehydratase